MPATHILRLPITAALLAITAGCALSMGTVSDVRIHYVPAAEVDMQGKMAGCCANMTWLRVDFVSDMDYADRARRGIPVWVHYGWCPMTDNRSFAVSSLFSERGVVDSGTTLTPVNGGAKRPLYAYHAFLPESSPARPHPAPGESDGAYDLRKANGDLCIAVRGGEMWTGRHGLSKGGVVLKATLTDAVGR